jgi:CRP-like cAMP-binding protein
MHPLRNDPAAEAYRTALMRFLNEFGLDATAILSLVRRTDPVEYDPGEPVLRQGEFDTYVYFLVKGSIVISIKHHEHEEMLGERAPVTLLGEISYFNNTPATATVAVKDAGAATFLRLSYEQFSQVIDEFPQIKPTLARIGEMRVISQMDGFISFARFMEMIGRKRDRLALNRALYPHLEETISFHLLPRLQGTPRVLEVGDGPGIISEVLKEQHADWEPNLFMQVTHLEDAVLNPLQSYPSDFSRAGYLRERFNVIVALQLFEYVKPDQIGAQFKRAASLLEPEGILLVIRLRVVDVVHTKVKLDTSLFFKGLEDEVRRVWPGVIDDEPLIVVSFVDADIDPLMEWNPRFCDAAIERQLAHPHDESKVERILLDVLLAQARRRQFNPEEINFHWLVWHAAHHGLLLEESHQNPETGFYYQLYRLQAAGKPA